MNLSPVDDHMAAIEAEYRRVCSTFPPMHSAHEGLAIIREEYMDLERVISWYGADKRSCQVEATQLAAMCLRYLVDVVGPRVDEEDMPW